MSLQLNRSTLAGHMTRDPELRTFAGDNVVANFGVAVNRSFKASDGTQREEVTFVDVEAWGKLADFIGRFFKKGTPVYVEGRLKLDQWTDRDGQKRSKLKLVAERATFVVSKGDDAPAGDDPIEHVDQSTGEITRRSTIKGPGSAKGGAR